MRCLLVPLEYRRAFFDMDGTILCEKPDYIEVALTRHRLLEKVRRNPKLESNPVYKAVIEGDAEYLYKNIKTAIAEAFEYHKSNLLKTATDNAWTVVSMKRDFRVLFPFSE